jgi:hypothetical protein
MKDQYFADINDYRKYGLLRILVGGGELTVAVCWMLTESDGRADGKHVVYLNDPVRWGKYDYALFDALASCMANPANRAVSWAEVNQLIPSAVYFSKLLPASRKERETYFKKFRGVAAGRDLVFFDPDNGIEVKSMPYGSRGSQKYLYWHELAQTYDTGHSVLVYQHFNRIRRETFIESIVESTHHQIDPSAVVTFSTANVLFLLLVQPRHCSYLLDKCAEVTTQWASQLEVRIHSNNGHPTNPLVDMSTL